MGTTIKQAESAQRLLNELFETGDKAAVSDLVISEVYFALQYHYNVPKSEALFSLVSLFESGEVVASGHAARVLKTENLARVNPDFVDRLIHADYRESFGNMATFEKKASKLEGSRVLR